MRIIDYFDNGARFYPNNVAFIDIDEGDASMTYAQAVPETHRIAAAIRANGFDKGAHVAVLAPNSTAAFLALLGLFRAEAVWLPTNPRNSIEVNADLLQRFDAELLLYHSSFEGEVEKLLELVPNIRTAVCIDGQSGAGESLNDWASDVPDEHVMGEPDMDALMAIFPTGGTTGKSKGVMITNRSIFSMFQAWWTHYSYNDNTAHLVVAPMTHSSGLIGCLHFARGGANVIMNKAAPAIIADAIEKYGITHLFLPPTVMYMMLALPDIRDRDYCSLQHFFLGAAPTSIEKLKEAIDVFGPSMSEGYGQAEAPASITAKAPWDYVDENGGIIDSRLQSVGRACVNNIVAIIDDDGHEVDRGTPGEICVKGEIVTPGYYKDETATAEARTFGWHHTGDVGVMDADGFITIVDRKKDMIISGGFNVFPNEIEQVMAGHPAVQDVAVIGIPDEKWGESVKGVIQLKPGAEAEEQELIQLCKDKLGGVKAPKTIDFMDDLPRSPNGKVLKTELRKPYWEGRNKAVN